MRGLNEKPSKWLGVLGHEAKDFPQTNFKPFFQTVELAIGRAAEAGYDNILFSPAGGSGHLAGITGLKKKMNLYLFQPKFMPDLAEWEKPTYSFLQARAGIIPAGESDWQREFIDYLLQKDMATLIILWNGLNNSIGSLATYAVESALKTLWINSVTNEEFWLC